MSLQIQVREFLIRHNLWHTPRTHVLDLASEVGEVAKALLEATSYGRSEVAHNAALAEESGDSLFSLIALAESLGVDLGMALNPALDKYEVRLAKKEHPGSDQAIQLAEILVQRLKKEH